MMNLRDDFEELEDFIRLDFVDLQASKNLQLLDPGIIDLECDSEEESTSIKEPEIFHAQPDLHSQSVTTSHSNTVDLKPMCIKVVDCHKFPWYFDKFKDNIEHKLAINQKVEVDDKIPDDSSTASLKELIANTHCIDMSVGDSVTMQRQANDCRKEVAELSKEIDAIAAKELLENRKPIPGAKIISNNVRKNKMDFDIQRGMEERENSVVDLKRNIGLVGMKILRLPHTIPSKLPIEISNIKQLKKPLEENTEKGQMEINIKGNKQDKGPTSSLHVKALEKVLMNVTSTTPVLENIVEETKDGVSTQNITGNSRLEPFIRSISGLVETKTNSNDTPLDHRCNFENELSLEISVNKIAEEIYRLVRPHQYVGDINRTIVPNFYNIMTTPTKVTDEKNLKRSKYHSECVQKNLPEGPRATIMIDPIPILPKKRKKDRIKSHMQSKASEIIDISDQMPPKKSSRKSEKTQHSIEANIVSNKKSENIKDHTAKEMSSRQQKESTLNEPTKSQKQSNNTIPSSILSKSIRENRPLPKQIDIGDRENGGTQEQLLNENDELKNIKRSLKISIAQLQYSKRNDFENPLSKENYLQNMTTNKVSTDLNVLVKRPENQAEKVSGNNYPESAQIIPETSITGTDQFPAVNPIEAATKNFAVIPTLVSNRETINSCTNFDMVLNHNSNVSNPAVIVNTSTQNNQSPVMTEPLSVYNSMQAHTLHKPPECSYQTFRQSQCDAVRFPSHIPQMNQPIYNYTGHPLQNLTHHPREILPHINTRPPSLGVNEKILPLMIHRLPMPPLQSTNFGAPMQNAIITNMPTRMRHPGLNGGFGAQMLSNPRPMSPFGVSSQIFRPQGTVSSQMPMNFPQMSIGEMLWSEPFSCIPPPLPPPPTPYQPAAQYVSTFSPKSVPQSIDSSIIGRHINGSVKKINITAPTIEQKEEIDSKAGIINVENLERDASTPLYDEIPTECFGNIDPDNTKKEMLRVLDTGLQRVYSRFDVLTPTDGIQNHAIQLSTKNDRPNCKKENLQSQGKLGKSPNDTTHEKCKSSTRKTDSAVENFIKVDRTPSNEHQKNGNIEPVNTKKEMLRILNTGLQRAYSRFDVLTPTDNIQNQTVQHSTKNGRPNSKKENLMSLGKLGISPNETTHEKCKSGTQKINSAVENLIKADRTLSKEHQKNYMSLPQKKENQHKSYHYLMNFIRKPKEKRDKEKEMPPKKCNESVRNKVENFAELHESSSIKISAKQTSCVPEQIKLNEKTKKTISNHLKFTQDYKKGNNSKKLTGKDYKITFDDLFGDGIHDTGYEKVACDKKSTCKHHSGLVNSEKTPDKSYESSVNLKRPANDENPALSPKYRPWPLSKKKQLNDQERVNPHQINKKQMLQSRTYSDPILPIPSYEKILSNMPSYLCFRDDNIISKT